MENKKIESVDTIKSCRSIQTPVLGREVVFTCDDDYRVCQLIRSIPLEINNKKIICGDIGVQSDRIQLRALFQDDICELPLKWVETTGECLLLRPK